MTSARELLTFRAVSPASLGRSQASGILDAMTARGQPAPVRARLVALNGELAGQCFPLAAEQYIGLRYCSDSEIAFPNTALGVSRRHMRVRFLDGRFVMEDCSTANGSYWNRERVESHALAHGDIIAAGRAEFRFELVE